MICRHCSIPIHQIEPQDGGDNCWSDGAFLVCSINADPLVWHEPLLIEEVIAGLQLIEADLR